jgi:type II restriction/modification system DNA methylase subunit YeeA
MMKRPLAFCIRGFMNYGHLATCTWHGVGNDPRYTPTTCFETFPFPDGLQPNQNALSPTPLPQAGEGLHIAEAARTLNELRENWLNPPQWVDRVPEIVPGYPDRIIPKPEHARRVEKAHPDEPLQPASGVAGSRPSCPG